MRLNDIEEYGDNSPVATAVVIGRLGLAPSVSVFQTRIHLEGTATTVLCRKASRSFSVALASSDGSDIDTCALLTSPTFSCRAKSECEPIESGSSIIRVVVVALSFAEFRRVCRGENDNRHWPTVMANE